jgi:hypothetical protein
MSEGTKDVIEAMIMSGAVFLAIAAGAAVFAAAVFYGGLVAFFGLLGLALFGVMFGSALSWVKRNGRDMIQ